MITIVS